MCWRVNKRQCQRLMWKLRPDIVHLLATPPRYTSGIVAGHSEKYQWWKWLFCYWIFINIFDNIFQLINLWLLINYCFRLFSCSHQRKSVLHFAANVFPTPAGPAMRPKGQDEWYNENLHHLAWPSATSAARQRFMIPKFERKRTACSCRFVEDSRNTLESGMCVCMCVYVLFCLFCWWLPSMGPWSASRAFFEFIRLFFRNTCQILSQADETNCSEAWDRSVWWEADLLIYLEGSFLRAALESFKIGWTLRSSEASTIQMSALPRRPNILLSIPTSLAPAARSSDESADEARYVV